MLGIDADGGWKLKQRLCPACKKFIFHLINGEPFRFPGGIVPYRGPRAGADLTDVQEEQIILVRPKGSSRAPCPSEVPENIAEDYREACLVLSDSPKASAALSRRCLQNVLRDAAKVKPKGNLANEIQEVIDRGTLPSQIADDLDAVRHIGNFAAHPMKSQITGQIVPVDPEEAEWTLDVLEALFDFYYVLPAKSQKRKDDFNRKLTEAGKSPIK